MVESVVFPPRGRPTGSLRGNFLHPLFFRSGQNIRFLLKSLTLVRPITRTDVLFSGAAS